jgi:uncharacterized OB-fold protein
MTTETPKRVVPQPDELTQPFWDAAAEGRLVAQRCQSCGFWSHPPRIICNKCHSFDMKWEPVSGKGTLYSFEVMHMQSITGFEDKVPYTTVLVELEEQPKLLFLGYRDGKGEDLKMGMPMEVFFEKIEGTDVTIPQFRPAK